MRAVNTWELRLKDEFLTPIFKAKGKPKTIMTELDDFLKQKGMFNVRKPKQNKRSK